MADAFLTDAVANQPMGQASAGWVTRAGVVETVAVLGEVLLPTIAKGVIMRRLAMAEALELDRRAVRRMQRVRDKHGPGLALILDPSDVHRVLRETPEPFATETKEKREALSHFEPKQALISHGVERAERRRVNEAALDSHRPAHAMAERFLR